MLHFLLKSELLVQPMKMFFHSRIDFSSSNQNSCKLPVMYFFSVLHKDISVTITYTIFTLHLICNVIWTEALFYLASSTIISLDSITMCAPPSQIILPIVVTNCCVTGVHPIHWLNFALLHLVAHYRYSIDRRTDMDRLFNVHPGNGSVFLLKSLDREKTAWHNISIIATEFRKCDVMS